MGSIPGSSRVLLGSFRVLQLTQTNHAGILLSGLLLLLVSGFDLQTTGSRVSSWTQRSFSWTLSWSGLGRLGVFHPD